MLLDSPDGTGGLLFQTTLINDLVSQLENKIKQSNQQQLSSIVASSLDRLMAGFEGVIKARKEYGDEREYYECMAKFAHNTGIEREVEENIHMREALDFMIAYLENPQNAKAICDAYCNTLPGKYDAIAGGLIIFALCCVVLACVLGETMGTGVAFMSVLGIGLFSFIASVAINSETRRLYHKMDHFIDVVSEDSAKKIYESARRQLCFFGSDATTYPQDDQSAKEQIEMPLLAAAPPREFRVYW